MNDMATLKEELPRISVKGKLPLHLLELVHTIDVEAISYPKRKTDVFLLERYFAAGDHKLATHMSNLMLQRQRQFAQVQNAGIPHWLQDMIAKMKTTSFDYLGRERDLKLLNDYLEAGDLNLSRITVDQIQRKQSTMRSRMIPAAASEQ